MHILREGGIELRPFAISDAPAFVAAILESQATVGMWMPWAHSEYAESDALAWFERCAANLADGSSHEFGVFRVSDGRLLGGAGLNQFNRIHNFCNLGYWVRQSAQRQGVATSAVRALLRLAFTHLGLTRVEIIVAEDNLPSIGVPRKAGGKHECLAANRLVLGGKSVAAHVYSFVPQC
jgi:ribosomal-protein-serine acetyltransferase